MSVAGLCDVSRWGWLLLVCFRGSCCARSSCRPGSSAFAFLLPLLVASLRVLTWSSCLFCVPRCPLPRLFLFLLGCSCVGLSCVVPGPCPVFSNHDCPLVLCLLCFLGGLCVGSWGRLVGSAGGGSCCRRAPCPVFSTTNHDSPCMNPAPMQQRKCEWVWQRDTRHGSEEPSLHPVHGWVGTRPRSAQWVRTEAAAKAVVAAVRAESRSTSSGDRSTSATM